MKGKQLRKALALIGGLIGSGAMVAGPAYANWVFNATASKSTTARVSVGNGLSGLNGYSDTSVSWLHQAFDSMSNEGDPASTFHWTATNAMIASGDASVTADASSDTYTNIGYLKSTTATVSGYRTADDGSLWPVDEGSITIDAVAPTNGLSAAFTATSHYHVGQMISFAVTETVASGEVSAAESLFNQEYTYTMGGALAGTSIRTASKVRVLCYWGTSSSGTQNPTTVYSSTAVSGTDRNGFNISEFSHTSSATTWTKTISEAINSQATHYLRAAIYDEYTDMTSSWSTLATIVYDNRNATTVTAYARSNSAQAFSASTYSIGSSSLSGGTDIGGGGYLSFFFCLYLSTSTFPTITATWGGNTLSSMQSSYGYNGQYYYKTYQFYKASVGGSGPLNLTFSSAGTAYAFWCVNTWDQPTFALSPDTFYSRYGYQLKTSGTATYAPYHTIEAALTTPTLSHALGTNYAVCTATLTNVCGDAVLYYYYSTQSGAPNRPSSFASGSQGAWTRATSSSSFTISNTSGATKTYYVYAFAACPTTGVSTSISSDSVSITATVSGASITAGTTTYQSNASASTIAIPAVYSGTTIRNTNGSGTLRYYVSTSSTAPSVGSSLYSSTSSTSITVDAQTGTLADQTRYVHAYVVNTSGTASSISTLPITIKASVEAPSCTHTHAWNSGWMTWRADSTWRNNSVYNLSSLRIVTIANERYDYSYGTYKSGKAMGNIRYGSNVAKDETFIPGSSNISPQTSIEQIGWGNAVTFGFGSYCQISYGGATSGWYMTYCEHDTEISSPTTTYSSSGVPTKYKNSSDFAISTIPLDSTTTVSYNG